MSGRHWPYVATGIVFAGVLGWISYTDALFVTRLAGNDGGIAYAYPAVPDGLLFFSLLALTEAARTGARRPGWATAGLVLGAAMTLAANAGAGLAHSVLDAVIDGLVPVCFFIAVEIVLWHIRRGRAGSDTGATRPGSARSVPSTVLEAAKLSMAETHAAGNPLSRNQLQKRWGLSRSEADEIWQPFNAPAGIPPTAGHRSVPAGVIPPSNGGPRD